MTLKQLKVLAKDCKKGEVMERILAMAQIDTIQEKYDKDHEATGISYITEEVKGMARTLLPFSRVTEWSLVKR